MNDLTEKEALYILRHRKEYNDSEINRAINKIKRINSHRAEYIKRYKKRLKDSISKKKIEARIKLIEMEEHYDYKINYKSKQVKELLQELLEDK